VFWVVATGLVIDLQPSSGCFHHCEHMALALVGLWEYDIIILYSYK